ncbi:MAG: hypothetical protein M1825_000507 [Sarcosagium campestre]|nr:MAG: hypothetical protein M1825_000507 [Sarcosagium campestre]
MRALARLKSPLAVSAQAKARFTASRCRSNQSRHSNQCFTFTVRHCSCSSPAPSAPFAPETTKNPKVPPADHRELAVQQELFTTDISSPGSPLFLPNGAHILNKLVEFLRAQYRLFGFQEVLTPTIYKKSLWETSGHWDNYKDDMYAVTGRGASGKTADAEVGEDEVYGLKPMNCPGHCLLFSSRTRSYRELPVRFADFSPLHRNEVSGALTGLTRVRRFHQDDGHIFCRPHQISEEITSTLEFIAMVYKALKLPPFRLVLSTRPVDSYIGTVDDWDRAEAALRASLDASGRQWSMAKGDGAFYGPKIDVILKDSDGKEHQTATIQLDFQLPGRFGLTYQTPSSEGEQHLGSQSERDAATALSERQGTATPVIIHRAVLGSLERFMALLIEHYNGKWPFWLTAKQAIILTVGNQSDETNAFVQRAAEAVRGVHVQRDEMDGVIKPQQTTSPTFAVDIDDSARSLGKKVSAAKRAGYSIIAVVGTKSADKQSLELDITGLKDVEASRLLLQGLLGTEALNNLRSISVTPAQMYDYFSLLSARYL